MAVNGQGTQTCLYPFSAINHLSEKGVLYTHFANLYNMHNTES